MGRTPLLCLIGLLLIVPGLIAACTNGSLQPITRPESPVLITAYHPDPHHLWNRLFAHFYVRTAPDGTVYGVDVLEPLLWPETTHLLDGPAHHQALELLDEFLAQDEETWLDDPLKRAFMQRDLWGVFDWTTLTADTYPTERRALQERLAATIQRLALTRAEIESLPDNYQAAVESALFAARYEETRATSSNPAGDPYLPPSLFASDGEWLNLGREGGPMALWHTSRYPFLGRSAFSIYIRLPGELEATQEFMQRLSTLERPGDGPQPPFGTELALVRRMMLIDDEGEIVVSPLVEKVQVQRRHPRSPFDWVSYEFKLARDRLFGGESGGLQAIILDDLEIPLFNAHPLERFFDEEARKPPMSTFAPSPILERCSQCHTYGMRSILSVSGHRFGLPYDEQVIVRETTPAREAQFIVEWKRDHSSWRQLASLLGVSDQGSAGLFSESVPVAGSAGAAPAFPQALDELVESAPLFVLGEVGPVLQYRDSVVYGANGQLLEGDEMAESPLPPSPATGFRVQVEQVIRDDGRVASGEPVVLRMAGTATAEMKELTQALDYPFSYTGDRHLFLLTPNPDGESYGFHFGPWSRLIVEDGILYRSDGAQSPLAFDDGESPMTFEEFLQAIP